jgi:hypothetical protein
MRPCDCIFSVSVRKQPENLLAQPLRTSPERALGGPDQHGPRFRCLKRTRRGWASGEISTWRWTVSVPGHEIPCPVLQGGRAAGAVAAYRARRARTPPAPGPRAVERVDRHVLSRCIGRALHASRSPIFDPVSSLIAAAPEVGRRAGKGGGWPLEKIPGGIRNVQVIVSVCQATGRFQCIAVHATGGEPGAWRHLPWPAPMADGAAHPRACGRSDRRRAAGVGIRHLIIASLT